MNGHDLAALAHALTYGRTIMLDAIKTNPVRLYSIAVALVALVAGYVTIPSGAILAVVAAVLGIGEKVRSVVTPVSTAQANETAAAANGFLAGSTAQNVVATPAPAEDVPVI